MFPRLLELGPVTLYSYGLLLALGYLAGLRLALVRARARGLNGDRVMDLGIWIIVSALVGAKLLLLYQDWRLFSSDPKQLLSLAQSAASSTAADPRGLVALWYIRRHKLPMWTTTDLFAPASPRPRHRPVRLFPGRLLLGTETTGRGRRLHRPVRDGQRRHAAERAPASTQLYESGAEA